MDRNIDTFAAAPLLDVPVPLMEEQLLLDVFRPHDREVPQLVIEVPKIICETSLRVPRLLSRSWQSSWWKCRRTLVTLLPSLPCKPLSGGQQRH